MAYTDRELIEELLEFKRANGRYPTRKDFIVKRISASKNAFYRAFGSVEKAAEQAERYERGELSFEEEGDIRKAGKRPPARDEQGLRCVICGSRVSNLDRYYSSLLEHLLLRFGELLERENGGSYLEGVLSSLNAFFSPRREALRSMLRKKGLLEKYDEMFSQGTEEEGKK